MQIIFELIFAYQRTFGAKALIDTGIMEALANTKHSIDNIAESCNVSQEHVSRLLRDLKGLKLYQQVDGLYQLTDNGQIALNESDWLTWLRRDNMERLWEAFYSDNETELLSILSEGQQSSAGLLDDALDTLSLMIFVRFGLHHCIPEKGVFVRELAEPANHSESLIHLILKRLAVHGVVSLTDDEVVRKTELFESLDKLENTVLGEARMKWIASLYLGQMINEKKDAHTLAFDEPMFEHLKNDPHEKQLFDQSMAATTTVENELIADALNLTGEQEIVDVGGGTGAFLAAFLEKNPHLSGVVFDLEESLTDQEVSKHYDRFKQRFRTRIGDFFEPETIPEMNTAIIKRVLHDWPDSQVRNILHSVTDKCNRLIIIEWLHDDGKFMSGVDLLLMGINGKLRTQEEFSQLVKEATQAKFDVSPRRSFADDFSLGYIEAALKPELQNLNNTSPEPKNDGPAI